MTVVSIAHYLWVFLSFFFAMSSGAALQTDCRDCCFMQNEWIVKYLKFQALRGRENPRFIGNNPTSTMYCKKLRDSLDTGPSIREMKKSIMYHPIDTDRPACTLKLPDSVVDSTRQWSFTRTKQIATVGPSTFTPKAIESLFVCGVDIFRVNFSHGEHHEKEFIINVIRSVEKKYNHPISILADLQGPKIRIGRFRDDNEKIPLTRGQIFDLHLANVDATTQDYIYGDNTQVSLPHPEIFGIIKENDVILVDDGKIRLRVVEALDTVLRTVVESENSFISSRKGVNIPSVVVPISALSPKDKRDALFAQKLGVDWIALSFVQSAKDVDNLRKLLSDNAEESQRGNEIGIVAKIERPSAVDNIKEILDASDGIMIARGDLGVEISPESVPIVQKNLINKCNEKGKPVIVATQMLESMIKNSSPTRAEASDIATAIYDGADAVMLSGESAMGDFPFEAVKMQRRVIEIVENDRTYWNLVKNIRSFINRDSETSVPSKKEYPSVTDAMTVAAATVSEAIKAKALVVFTTRGSAVEKISRQRPHVPIIAITPFTTHARRLQLSWGIYPVVDTGMCLGFECNNEETVRRACKLVQQAGFIHSKNDSIVITAVLPFADHNNTYVLRVCKGGNCDGAS